MRYPALLMTLLALASLAGCKEEIPPGNQAAAREVVTGLEQGRVARTVEAGAEALVGTVQRPDRSTLTARIDGQVSRFGVKEGQTVAAGEVLLVLKANQAPERLQEAEAGLREARRRAAAVKARQELASKTFERYARLREGEAVTAQELDRVRADLEAAAQELSAARAATERAAARRDAARVGVASTRITAPYRAVVVRKEVREGATVVSGTPLVTLETEGSWQVRVDVPESLLSRVGLDQALPVRIPSANLEVSGRVSEILPSVAVLNRSFPVKLELPGHPGLQSGQFARVLIPGPEQVRLTVPADAVVTRGQLTGIYVVEDGILHYRLIKTGRSSDGWVEILSGLEGGETIVTGNTARARHGARVGG